MFIVVFVLIFLSLFPRSVEALNGNPVFGFDQGRDYLAVKEIVVNHKFTLIGAELGAGSAGFSYVFQGPGYYYLLSIPFIISKGDPQGGIWLMLFLGLSTIVFGWYLTRKFWGNTAGLLTVFLLATSPYLIPQSRFFWNPHAPTLFILIAFYFTYLFSKDRRLLFIFLASFFAAFVYNFEFAIAIPLSITIFIYNIFLFKNKFIYYPPLIAGFFIGFFPMILFEIRHGFMGFKNLFNYLSLTKEAYSTPATSHINELFNTFIFNFADTFPGRIIFEPKFMALLILGLTIFVVIKEKDKIKRNFLLFLLLLIPVHFFVFTFLKSGVYSYYLTALSLSYILIFAYISTWFFKNKYYKLSALFSLFLILLFTTSVESAVKTSLADLNDYGGTAKLKGKIDAIDFIYNDANKKPFGLLVFSPPVYTYPYDYLIWWRGQKKFGYTPYKNKKGIFYLLIEKDNSKPWSYKGWEETVVKTGKVIFTKTLPSGFIVEKRDADKQRL